MIKYLIKFVSQKSHADMLVAGELFMRPASYYHKQELGQGDIFEACILPPMQMYYNADLPIYCLYAVRDSDIHDGKIKISSKCIQDFKCSEGYAVIIQFEPFEKILPTLDTDGYAFQYGDVKYTETQISDLASVFNNKEYDNLFIKLPYFFHQKEFRIVVGKHVCYKNEAGELEPVIYRFPKAIDDICRIVSIYDQLTPEGDCELLI